MARAARLLPGVICLKKAPFAGSHIIRQRKQCTAQDRKGEIKKIVKLYYNNELNEVVKKDLCSRV